MARRPRPSPIQSLLWLLARLPWWLCLVFALASYLLLHTLAASTPALATAPPAGAARHSPLALIGPRLLPTLAGFFQIVVPLLLTLAAALSAWQRHRRKRLADEVAHNLAANALLGMPWQQFEQLVGEAFRRQGYRVVETGRRSADGGVDLVLSRHGEQTLVQCKQWRAFKVGVEVVRELYGVMAAQGAAAGIVVTSGRFTQGAQAFTQGRNISLMDGEALRRLLQPTCDGSPPRTGAASPDMERQRP